MKQPAVAQLVDALDAGRPVRDALANALGDDELSVFYWLDQHRGFAGGGWVDPQGRAVPDPSAAESQTLQLVHHGGDLIAAVVYESRLDAEPDVVGKTVEAARLALQNDRLQAALHAEVAFMSTVTNTAPSLLVNIGTDGRIRNINVAALEASGLDADTARGELYWNVFIDPAEREAVRDRFHALAPRFEAAKYENTFTNARGEVRTISWHAAPVADEHGQVVSIVSGGLDITERRRRELELERERDATTTVLEAIRSVVVVLDRDGVIRDRDVDNPRVGANRAFRQALGWRDDELVGRRFLELVVEDEDGRAAAAIARAAAGAASDEVESELHGADGGIRAFAWSAVPVADVTERTEALVLVSGTDVTERKLREAEDRRRRAYIDAITETIPSFILILETDATVREEGVNTAFAGAFGWTPSELGGKGFVGAVVPESDHAARMLIANAANGVIEDEIESRWETRDGDSRIVAWSARPVTALTGARLVLVTGADVTTRRLQEEEIRASRARLVSAADEARRRLERDLHDGAQQRLVSLSVLLRLAESRVATGGEGVAEMLEDARTELTSALEELRELARGIHPAILTDRGLGPALQSLAARAPLPVALKHPELPLPPAVEATAYFVAAEALTNVIKYARASSASIEVAVAEELVTVTVGDDGVGGADPQAGSGLRGLADRLASLDGRLVVESSPGGGTQVRAEIPLEEEAET